MSVIVSRGGGGGGGVRERDWALPGFALSPQSR